MARTMKRKYCTSKQIGKKVGNQKSKRNSKKIYKKKNFTKLRKTTMKKGRRGSRKMHGGAYPFDSDESGIQPVDDEEEEHELDLDAGEGEQDLDLDDSLNDGSLHLSDLNSVTRESGNTTGDSGLSESNPDLSVSSYSTDQLEGEEEEPSQLGGKKRKGRKGKKTQKRRRVKKGGELSADFNPNDREDPDHN